MPRRPREGRLTLPAALEPIARSPRDSAFVTDFDGTLAPIVDDPDRAAPLPEALDALRALTPRLRLVGVVSGRPVSFLRERVPVDGIVLVGQYGLEKLVDGEVVVDPRVDPYLDAVASGALDAARAWPDLLLERKGDLAFTLHWRTAPDAEPDPDDLNALANRYGLVTQRGRKACELRPPVEIDKGTATRDLLEQSGADVAVFAGDDRGDLAAFDALDAHEQGTDEANRRTAVRIAVRSTEAPAELLQRANVVVEGPPGLAALLGELAAAVSAPG